VAAIDLNATFLRETAQLANRSDQGFGCFISNVSDREQVQALPQKVMAHFGTVDGVINNAGIIQPFSRLNDLDYAVIERVINVNLLGTLFMTKEFLPFLLQRPEANITNISSMGGFIPFPGQTMYGASKAAVKLMTEGLASELLHTKVHVTVVFPGAVATNISANSGVNMAMNGNTEAARKIRALPPARAAEIILNGIERNARRVFVGRDSALLDKLYRLAPGMAARAIASQMRALLPE
jgi:short-subunit dehydrogenase